MSRSKEKTAALLEWADQLDGIELGLPAEKFDMFRWTQLFDMTVPMPEGQDRTPSNHCGTSACAAGWLPAIFPDDWKMDAMDRPALRNNEAPLMFGFDPVADVQRYFGLTRKQSARIVLPDQYRGPRDHIGASTVARRIRKIAQEA